MLGITLFLAVVAMAVIWVVVFYEFRRVLRIEDREIFNELARASRGQFSLPGPWVDFAESVELKSISNPRLRRAATQLTAVYRGLKATIFFGPAFLLLCMLGYALVVART